MDPLMVNALVAIIVLLVFLIQGVSYFREVKDEEAFFLFGRKLLSKEYSPSFAAASSSLATVLYFFVTFGVQHGLYIFFAPLTYILGCYLYSKLFLPRLEAQGFFKSHGSLNEQGDKTTLGTTLGNYIEDRYASKCIKFTIIFITTVGLMSILLIELYIGVTVFSIYLKPRYVDWALLLISLTVFTYTGLGGLLAVVKTDVVQFKFMLFSVVVFLGWLVWESVTNQRVPGFDALFPHSLIFQGGLLLPYTLLFNMLVVNIFLIPALLRTWQMAAASPSSGHVRKGIINGVWLNTVLTAIFVLIGIFFFRSAYPDSEISLDGILKTLYISQDFFPAYVIFPLFFAACLAALISTADSALIPVLHSIFQDFRKSNIQPPWQHSKVLMTTAVLLVIANGCYFLVFRVLGFNLVSWLFTIFSFLIICTPAIAFAVIAPTDMVRSRSSQISALISIWGGFAVAVTLSVVGNKLKIIEIVQLNSPLAAVFGSVVLLVHYGIEKRRVRK